MNLVSILQQKGIVTDETAAAVTEQLSVEGTSVEKALLSCGVAADTIRNALGEYYELPTAHIDKNDAISPDVLKYLPEESARHYKMIPLRLEEGVLTVGVIDPENYGLRDALGFITAKHHIPYELEVILESDLETGLHFYENLSGEVDEALEALSVELSTKEPEESSRGQQKNEVQEVLKEDAPVTKIVATVLRYAVDGSASDVHIEPYASRVIVRFRIDGILMRSLELPKKVHKAVVARVKILSSLRLDEQRKPQDGRFSATIDERRIDFRVSILPTNHGEKVVIRILDSEKGVRSLEETGVSEHNIALIRKAIEQPYGIILISGPTGSGKSTTLYAMLSEVDRQGKNVMSLEDPIEYDIEGVSQSQVRPEIGYTFATGLRSALRQDPDVILVGEIRDTETAQLAIQAALTGHLVLSTIHTNNAIGVIPRLIDMGVDPYLIAPTLQLALAQRLVRRIYPGTGKKIPIEGSVKAFIDHEFEQMPAERRSLIPKATYVLQPEPTPESASGMKGRVAVMEAVQVDKTIEQLILQGVDENKLNEAARKNGYVSMKEDALIKAMNHLIPLEEASTLGGAYLMTDEDVPPAQGGSVDVDNPQIVAEHE